MSYEPSRLWEKRKNWVKKSPRVKQMAVYKRGQQQQIVFLVKFRLSQTEGLKGPGKSCPFQLIQFSHTYIVTYTMVGRQLICLPLFASKGTLSKTLWGAVA